MKKIIELPERFATGEPTVMVVAHWNGSRHILEKAANYRPQGVVAKYASEAFDYVSTVTPRDGETMILVNALGTFETYDDNRNGDGFNEVPYMVGVKPRCQCEECSRRDVSKGWVTADQTVVNHYKSFEKHGGIYQHHVNKDPAKSLGRVERAFFNTYMKRVELLLAIRNSLAPDWISEIEAGIYAPVSMGCHVRYDVCANCGHYAPTRKEYCEHLKWEMRKIDPVTGCRNCALNPSPRFFDISKVFRPADPQGFMMKKVADVYEIRGSLDLGEKIALFEEKQATIGKLSEIQKVLVGEISMAKLSPEQEMLRTYRKTMMRDALANMEPAGPSEISAMSEHSLPEVSSTLAAKSAGLTTSEFFAVMYKRAGFGTPDPELLDRAVALQPLVTAVFTRYPDIAEKIGSLVIPRPELVRPDLTAKLGRWLEKRSTMGDFLTHQMAESGLPGTQGLRDREPPRTDVLYVTDPNTGERYTTTRGAAMAAHDEEQKANLMRHVGGTLLLSGAYRAGLGHYMPGFAAASWKFRTGVPLAAGALTAHKLLPKMESDHPLVSDEGYHLSDNTEMLKEHSLREPFSGAIPPTKFANLMAFDYVERLGKTASVYDDLTSKLQQKLAASRSNELFVKLHSDPAHTVAALFHGLEKTSGDPSDAPTVNIDAVATRLGLLLVI